MKDKDFKKLERVVEKIIKDMFESETEDITANNYADETCFPTSLLEEMEACMGEEITFMGIA